MTDLADQNEAIDMIRASARGIADRGDLARIRALRFSRLGFDRSVWADICAAGWPALRLSEDSGGIGLGLTAYVALAEEAGAALLPEPLIDAVLASALLEGRTLADHLGGSRLVLPAWQDGRDAAAPERTLRTADDRLSGRKRFVALAGGADAFVVVEPDAAWLVDAHAPGLGIDVSDTQDGGHVATLVLEDTPGERIEVDPAPAFAEACLATAAYLLGMIDAALTRTLDYMLARVQFGVPIGSFQALQHRAVDLRLQVELTRASVEEAAARWDSEGATPVALAGVSRAKARAANAALLVTREAVQLHGGIGYTDEHDIGLFLRKAMVVAPRFGSAALHRARFAQLMPLEEER